MERVKQLIEQALTTPSKSKGCGCGCGCGGEKVKSPILKEVKAKALLSEGLNYHIDNKISLFECEYRIGSEAHLSLIRESRKLYSRGVIDVSESDKELLETDLGHFAEFKGELIPLDLPMLNEAYSGFLRPGDPDYIPFEPTGSVSEFQEDLRALFGKFKGDLKDREFIKGVAEIMVNWKSLLRSQLEEAAYDSTTRNELAQYIINLNNELASAKSRGMDKEIEYLQKDIEEVKAALAKKKQVKEGLEEADYQGKDVELNKPKRGGSKAYYVYVKDGDKVKKVSFGSGGLKAKINNKEARNNFASRHNCKDKKDRTTPGYWSCNLPKYAKVLGMGANMNTYW